MPLLMHEQNPSGRQQLGGIILAGGKSHRMGTDKANLRLRGRTFVEHLVTKFQSAGLPVVIVGSAQTNCAPAEKQDHGSPVLFTCDQRLDAGPLEGVRMGLATLAAIAEFGFVISCDSPLLKMDLVSYLFTRIGSFQAIAPRSESKIFGTTAIYRTEIHPLIEQEFANGNHSVKKMLGRLHVQYIEVDELRVVDPELVSLININTPEEYERVLVEYGA